MIAALLDMISHVMIYMRGPRVYATEESRELLRKSSIRLCVRLLVYIYIYTMFKGPSIHLQGQGARVAFESLNRD